MNQDWALNISVSLILPAFNANYILQQELPPIVAWMRKHFIHSEIIVVDDGSETWLPIETLCEELGCIFLRLPFNSGKGAALRKGFQVASGDIQIFTDCDIPFQYKSITEIAALLQTDDIAVVVGDRTLPQSEYYQKISPIRKWGSNLIASLASRLLLDHISDTQCGLKGFTRNAAIQIFSLTQSNRFGIDFEILYICTKLKLSIHRIPVQLRTIYPSTVRLFRDGWFTIIEIGLSILKHANKKPHR